MLNFHSQLKVFLATAACDLRMSFNGLWAAAQQQLGEDPKSAGWGQPIVWFGAMVCIHDLYVEQGL